MCVCVCLFVCVCVRVCLSDMDDKKLGGGFAHSIDFYGLICDLEGCIG